MTANAPQPGSQSAPQPRRGSRPPQILTLSGQGGREWPCWIVSRVDGLNIRERATADSRSDGYLNTGQSIPARCEAVSGASYQSCGGSHWWIPVLYEGSTHYVAWACVDWYSSDPPPRPQPPQSRTYVVQPGDTLSAIARRFGVSLSALEAANPQIPDFNRIFPGQVINIP
jgi:nucleoid-associated protein YgaU